MCVCMCGIRVWTHRLCIASQVLICGRVSYLQLFLLWFRILLFAIAHKVSLFCPDHPEPSQFMLPATARMTGGATMPAFFCWDGVWWNVVFYLLQ
jgi:hypothetical protein